MWPKVNVVIRTYNEEDWIRFCLLSVFNQDYQNLQVTVVDSGSLDRTLDIVRDFESVVIIHIQEYKPGYALNEGVRAANSDYFICLSAHCLPVDPNWIQHYVEFMESRSDIAGAFGRQLPLSCTQPDDARDLLITFGDEFRVNKRDCFFHNANSIVRNLVWNEFPFDEKVPHVEDRVWAKQIISNGQKTAYLPEAAVYHYHGLHQHGNFNSFRAVNVLSVMSSLEDDLIQANVFSLLKKHIIFPIVIIIPPYINQLTSTRKKLEKLMSEIEGEKIFIVCGRSFEFHYLDKARYEVIRRDEVSADENISMRELMHKILCHIENKNSQVLSGLVFFDLSYKVLNFGMARKCKELLFNRWLPSVLPAWRDFGNYWIQRDGMFQNIQSSYELREEKPALFRSVLGQGGAVRASLLRSEKSEIPIGEVIWTDDISLLLRETLDVEK